MFRSTHHHRPRRVVRWAAAGTGAAVLTAAVGLFAAPVDAFKPYTHNESASRAFDDLVDDGHVTIDGVEYPVRPEIYEAVKNQPAAYNAGVIGPDGFPDLAYGQSQIHPEETGKWLEHIYTAAWDAQDDPARSTTEKQQILAFAYGFMTHAAGDMWAHTLINKIADGVFPGVGDILNPDDLTAAEIALRHVIAEGYVGDATAGYDGNPERSIVQGEYDENDVVDYSDDATPRFEYAAPTDWIYETLVDPTTPLPVGTCGDGLDDDADGTADDGCPGGPFTVGDPEPNRGPLIDYFLDLQADLEIEAAKWEYDAGYKDCNIADGDCFVKYHTISVPTVRGTAQAQVEVQECDFTQASFCFASPIDAVDDAVVNQIGSAYMRAWIEDIQIGLQHWPELGQQLSRALFDSGTYRDAQNFWCRNHTKFEDGLLPETDRVSCEEGVGLPIVILYTLGGVNGEGGPSGFIPEYLLSMLGAPDFVGDAFEFAGDAATWLQDVLAVILPDIDIFDGLIESAKELLLELLSEALGFDVELLGTFLKSPTHWMEVGQATFDLPFAGTKTVDLFQDGDREYLDQVMGLEDPLVGEMVELPDGTVVPSSRLADDAVWSYEDFEVGHNALVMSKLLLLDGAQLNSVIAGGVADTVRDGTVVSTYVDQPGRPANVMIDGLGVDEPWLRSIDSDHAWRADRQPVFDGPDHGHGHGDTDAEEPHYAGTGRFPLWESCLARPVFRSLFRDWESGDWQVAANNFPDYGDAPSNDPSVQDAPAATFTIGGSQAVVGGDTWIGGDHSFTVVATDAVFTDAGLTTRYRAYPAGGPASGWTTAEGAQATFDLFDLAADAADGSWVVEWEVASPCLTTAGSVVVNLDTVAPEITIHEPAAAGYDTDDLSSIQYTADDAGSGVAMEQATLDGLAAQNGQQLDMFELVTGPHLVSVTASDFVGNTAEASTSFVLLATSVSLRNNIDRALAEGLISKPDVHRGLKDKLDNAVRSHSRGRHDVEVNALNAVILQLAAQRGTGVDATFADRMTGWVEDLVASES